MDFDSQIESSEYMLKNMKPLIQVYSKISESDQETWADKLPTNFMLHWNGLDLTKVSKLSEILMANSFYTLMGQTEKQGANYHYKVC
jgi:hypothetical protein